MSNVNSNDVLKTRIFDPDVGVNTYLSGFHIEDACYHHYINLDNDGTFIINDEYEILFEVDSSGHSKLMNADIGKFSFSYVHEDIWEFKFINNIQEKILTGTSDLIKAEVMVFKILSKRGFIKNG